uniref:DUF148 domain-containing protein n=1 Tax=Caenorhabditis japonica TaxID=281687 RepID=A0A8R1HIA2_CAEJA
MRFIIVLCALLIPYTLSQLSHAPPPPPPDGSTLPKFLMRVPRFARKEFFDIIHNDQLSMNEQNAQLTIWAKALNVTQEFNQWIQKVQKQKDSVSHNTQTVVANISTVYTTLENILSNTNLSRREQQEQIRNLSSTSPKEMDALFFIARNRRSGDKTPFFPQMALQPNNGFEKNRELGASGGAGHIRQTNQLNEPRLGFEPQIIFLGLRGPGKQDGQGSDFGPQNDFPRWRGLDGPSELRRPGGPGGQMPNFGPRDDFPGRRRWVGPGGHGRPGGPGSQGPYFGPQDDFPGRRGPSGRGGPGAPGGRGPAFESQNYFFERRGPGGQGPNFGPHDDFPGRRGSGGPSGPNGGHDGPGGPGRQVPDFGPQSDFSGRRGPGGRGGPGGPGGYGGPGGPGGQGLNFRPYNDFPGRRGLGGPDRHDGPGGPGGQRRNFGPRDDFPGRRGPGGPSGRHGGPGGPGGQRPDFGPQNDFPGSRGPGGPNGPSGRHGGPGGPGGQRPDFGPQNDFPGRRGPGGPNGNGGPGGPDGQGPNFGPRDDFPGRRGPGGPSGRHGGPGGPGGQRPTSDLRMSSQDAEDQAGQVNVAAQENKPVMVQTLNQRIPKATKEDRQSNSPMRFDQSSGFGMRRSQSNQDQQQNNNFANNQ